MSNAVPENAPASAPDNAPALPPKADGDPNAGPQKDPEPVPGQTDGAKPPPAPSPASPQPGIQTGARFKDVQAESISVIGQQIKNIFTGEERSSSRTFSFSMGDPLPMVEEHEQAAALLQDPKVVAEFVSSLLDRRLLLITADPDSGKGSTAICLARELRRRDPNLQREMLRVLPLDASIRIDVREIAANEKEFGQRIIFFKDALSRQNRDLRKFLECLDEGLTDSLRRVLETSGSYLLMTADTHSLLGVSNRLESLQICVSLPQLPEETLSKGLDRILLQVGHKQSIPEDLRKEILSLARSIPRISRFAKEYLVALSGGVTAVRESFAKIDNISLWFFGDLADDFEAWSFALVLVLAQPLPDADRVPWSEFQELYWELVPAIRNWTGKPEKSKRYRRDRVSDEAMLKKTQSLIERDVVLGRDVLRFREPTYVERLWSKILNHSKGLLVSLVPSLIELVESKNVRLRIRAAQIVGRIGEIDPVEITLPVVRRLAKSGDRATQAAVGHIFHGILSSADQGYKSTCLTELEEMAKSKDDGNVWTAIAAYKQTGVLDLTLALGKLKTIAEEKLAPKVLATNDILRTLRKIEQELGKTQSGENAIDLLVAHELLQRINLAIVNENVQILFAVQYAIVSLCIALDPIQVLGELRSWMFGGEGLRVLACLIYLQSNGIAEALRERPVTMEDATVTPPKRTVSNLIVTAMASDSQAPKRVSDFLKDIFVSFSSFFPLELARFLKKSFLAHLSAWAESASSFPRGLQAMEDLFVSLLIAQIPELETDILEMLRYDGIFVKQDAPLHKFAGSVVARSLLEREQKKQPRRFGDLPKTAVQRA